MTHTEAIAIRTAQLSGKPVADDDAQVALLVIELASPSARKAWRKNPLPRKKKAAKP